MAVALGGSAFAGLHGIALVNASLAALGGGSLAAGGLGRRRNRNNCWRWRSLGGSWVWHSLLNSDGIAHLEGLRCSGVCQTSGLLLLLYQSRANGSSGAEGYTYGFCWTVLR